MLIMWWIKALAEILLSLIGLIGLFWLDQVLGQAFFALVFYLWRVNARPQLINYWILTLVTALILSGIYLTPWWINTLILVCANGLYVLINYFLKRSRLSLIASAAIGGLVVEIMLQKSVVTADVIWLLMSVMILLVVVNTSYFVRLFRRGWDLN